METTTSVKKPARPKSRMARWTDAAGKAREALDSLASALAELGEVRSEYEDWRGNLPENLDSSALAEKLDAVIEIDLENCLDEVEDAVSSAEQADLPRGFGRD